MNGWWRVGAWWIGLLGVGWCCLASTIDRLAGQGLLAGSPALQTGGQALGLRAALALEQGQAATAAGLGRAAVARRPTDPAVLRVAGAAALAAGDAAAGDRLLRLAGAAGWRDIATQHYWAAVSIRAGAWDVAAERLDAALRLDPGDRVAAAGLRAMERDPAGNAALVRRLLVPNEWAADWLATLDGADRTARVPTLRRVWPTLPLPAQDRIGWALVAAGAVDEARELSGRGDGIPSLAAARSDAGPFEWSLLAGPTLQTGSARWSGRPALLVQANDVSPVPVASTVLPLPAGVVRLTIAVAWAHTDLPLLVSAACSGGRTVDVVPARGGRDQAVFELRSAGCGAARVEVAVSGEEAARGADLWLGAVSLSSAP